MATKFFKKFEPKLGVNIGGNQVINFPTNDNVIGYYATNDERIQGIITGYINSQQYGISEITWTEYDTEFLKKKKSGSQLRKPWRDEWSNQGSRNASIISPAVQNAVAVVSEPRQENGHCAVIEESQGDAGRPKDSPISAPTPPGEFQPNVGKRPKTE